MQPVPHTPSHLSTWAWWVVIVICVLHAAHTIPCGIIGGMFAMMFAIAISGTCVAWVTSNKKHFFNTDNTFEAVFSPGNVGQHVLPFLIVCLTMLYRPCTSTYAERLMYAFILPLLYVASIYIQNQNVSEHYHRTFKDEWAAPAFLGLILVGGAII